jgi:Protein of unknown function (DUF1524)
MRFPQGWQHIRESAKRSKNLADQRRFMRETFDGFRTSLEQQQFIRHLADLAAFFDATWVDGSARPKIGDVILDDVTALCVRFLVDLDHTITAPLLAQYAAEVASTSGDARTSAIAEFNAVARGVVAFAVLWRASRTTTDRIDQVFRDLMAKGSKEPNVPPLARGLRGAAALPKADVLKSALVAKLKADRASGGAGISDEGKWIDMTIAQPIYDVNTTLARFLLLAAFHDTIDENGKLVVGKSGTQPTLKFDAWIGDTYATVEHIAPQTRGDWPEDLYSDDQFDRLGNLTLLPSSANQSLGNRPWHQKRTLYGALAAPSAEKSKVLLDQLAAGRGEPQGVSESIYCGHYLPHVYVLSNVQDEWNLAVVDKRGREIAELAWNRLAEWVNF